MIVNILINKKKKKCSPDTKSQKRSKVLNISLPRIGEVVLPSLLSCSSDTNSQKRSKNCSRHQKFQPRNSWHMTLFQRLQESHSSDTPDYLVIGAKQGFVMSKIYIYIYIYRTSGRLCKNLRGWGDVCRSAIVSAELEKTLPCGFLIYRSYQEIPSSL